MYWLPKELPTVAFNITRYWLAWITAFEHYKHDFESAYFTAIRTALTGAIHKPLSPSDTLDLYRHKLELVEQAFLASTEKMAEFHAEQTIDGYQAWINSLFGVKGEDFTQFTDREATVMEGVAYDFPKAIENIKDEFGFQFHTDGYQLVLETDCFKFYQVLPTNKDIQVKNRGKPVLLIPPYMLGVHILAFLPGEGKSFTHAFANKGIPTYVRVVKDIDSTPAVQTMTCEDDCLQTQEMCALLKEKHGHPVTLTGVCQGGYVNLINILSGKLKGLVDALITVVTPVDGTQSKSLGGYLQSLPAELSTHYMYDTLPNGNKVANGEVMSLGFKLLALSKEAPLVAMYNMKALHKCTGCNPGKTAAAINRWLRHERTHLPIALSEMSAETFKTPISEEGNLPVKLFDQRLNLHDLKKLGVKWYIAYAKGDDLVEMESAIAALPHLKDEDVLEVTEFPGGHVGILTSFAGKDSRCPLDGEFNGLRGPVRFHLSLQEATWPLDRKIH